MLQDLKRYSLELFTGDFIYGFSDGFCETVAHPIVVGRSLRTQAYERIVNQEVEQRRWEKQNYLNPDYKMRDEDVFRKGYNSGVYAGLFSSLCTCGIVNFIVYGVEKIETNRQERHSFIITLLEEPKPNETATLGPSKPSTLKTIKFS